MSRSRIYSGSTNGVANGEARKLVVGSHYGLLGDRSPVDRSHRDELYSVSTYASDYDLSGPKQAGR